MTEEAQSEETTLKPVSVPDAHIREILGFIKIDRVQGFKDASCDEDGASNNTRWVFDVRVNGSGALRIHLLNVYGRLAKTDIEPSFHFTPLSLESYKTKVWGETDRSVLTLGFDGKGEAAFRIDVDIIGSNRR